MQVAVGARKELKAGQHEFIWLCSDVHHGGVTTADLIDPTVTVLIEHKVGGRQIESRHPLRTASTLSCSGLSLVHFV
eukprot:43295-Amphidinium_carterae.1